MDFAQKPAALKDCRILIQEKQPFVFTHLFAELMDGFTFGYSDKPPIYTVYSYSRSNPILVFDFGRERWVGLKDLPKDKITQLHISLVDSNEISHWASHEELVNISTHGLSGEVTSPRYTGDKFIKARDPKESLAEYIAVNGPIYDHPIPEATISKINIKNPDWYHKAVGMLSHNYATISEDPSGKTIVYFFYDEGRHHGRLPKYISMACRKEIFSSTSCIVDSINFDSIQIAKEQLEQNGFKLIAQESNENFLRHVSKHHPKGESFFDVREFVDGPYSKEGFWI